MSSGYTSGWLSGTLGRSLIAREVECSARGDEACRFEVQEASVWMQSEHDDVRWLLSEVPFEAFRKAAVAPPIERHAGRPAPVASQLECPPEAPPARSQTARATTGNLHPARATARQMCCARLEQPRCGCHPCRTSSARVPLTQGTASEVPRTILGVCTCEKPTSCQRRQTHNLEIPRPLL